MSFNKYPKWAEELGDSTQAARKALDRISACNHEFYAAEMELRSALIKLQNDRLTTCDEFKKALERLDRMRELESMKDTASITIPLGHAITEAWRKLP